MAVHYLEIVSDDVDMLVGLYQHAHDLSFGPPDPDLGQARVATQSDGTLVGIRKRLAAHEQPIMRAYLEVKDIQQATKKPRSPARRLPIPQPGRATTAPLQSSETALVEVSVSSAREARVWLSRDPDGLVGRRPLSKARSGTGGGLVAARLWRS